MLTEKNQCRRNKQQMEIDVLRVIGSQQRGILLTHIMYKANINCNILKTIVDNLITKELIFKNVQIAKNGTPHNSSAYRRIQKNDNKYYFITENGKELLNKYYEGFNTISFSKLNERKINIYTT
jgi:predicted transcriptional regulator